MTSEYEVQKLEVKNDIDEELQKGFETAEKMEFGVKTEVQQDANPKLQIKYEVDEEMQKVLKYKMQTD